MKKIIALLLVSAMLLSSFAACKRNEPEPEVTPPSQSEPETKLVYQNGEYSVKYGVQALDRTLDFLTVSITDDAIEIVEYGAMEDTVAAASDAPEAASSDASSAASSSDSEASSEATEAEALAAKHMDAILNEYEMKDGNLDEMTPVKDAEEHTYRFIRMMRTALECAKTGDTTSVTLGKYADGNYKSTMPTFNADGWKEYVELTVKDGQISTISFDAVSEKDPAALITADAELNKAADGPSTYYPQIAKNFTEAGDDLTKTFAPTNGGPATKVFGKLVRPLLVNMISGGETEVVAAKYIDGTYKAEFKDFDEHGWKEYVVLEIVNDKISVVEFDAVSKADEKKRKSQDSEIAAKHEEKTGISFDQYESGLISSWNKSGNDVTKVDNVAGATISSNNFKLLVGQILATVALEGDFAATLVIEPMTVK